MLQGVEGRLRRRGYRTIQGADSVQGPERVDRGCVEADRIDLPVSGEPAEGRDHVVFSPLYEQALGVHPPEHIVVGQLRNQLRRVGLLEVERFVGVLAVVDEPVDASMHLVPQRRHVGVAPSVLVAPGGGVVLDDVIVPVNHPDHPIRTDLREDGRRPFVITGQQVPAVARQVVAADALDEKGGDEVPGGAVDEGGAVPIVFWVAAGGIEGVPGPGGEVVVLVHLPDVGRDRIEARRLGGHTETTGGPPPHRLVIAVGDGHVDARIAVGG